jgi:hypothetical protein
MFASLSDYIDDLAADAQSREMEKHLDDGEPCVAFLDSLKSAVDQCRTYEPTVTPPGPRNCAKTLTRNTRQRLPRCRRIAASPRTGIHTDLHEWRPFSYSS